MHVLILGGTSEAREVAAALAGVEAGGSSADGVGGSAGAVGGAGAASGAGGVVRPDRVNGADAESTPAGRDSRSVSPRGVEAAGLRADGAWGPAGPRGGPVVASRAGGDFRADRAAGAQAGPSSADRVTGSAASADSGAVRPGSPARVQASAWTGRPLGTDMRVTTSLAGRVSRPGALAGETRVGGFGGVAGLGAWLREHRVTAVVDATHPFASRMTHNAVAAAAETGVPLVVLRRPGWAAGAGDRWYDVGSLAEAAALVPSLGRRVLLTTGRLELAAFAHITGVHFVTRSVEPPDPPMPDDCEVLLARGPFSLDDELRLLRQHRIDAVVTKDSGGVATAAKLVAARELGLPVVVVRRPALPSGVTVVGDVGGVLEWLGGLRG